MKLIFLLLLPGLPICYGRGIPYQSQRSYPTYSPPNPTYRPNARNYYPPYSPYSNLYQRHQTYQRRTTTKSSLGSIPNKPLTTMASVLLPNKQQDCGLNAEGIRTLQGLLCECKTGYFKLRRSSPCIDHDECSASPGICGADAICTNTGGSYSCSCQFGYTGQPPDIPCSFDCSYSPLVCGVHGECQHNDGVYSCWCNTGYCQYDLTTGCIDLDECTEHPEICGPNAKCINSEGTYKCECPAGFYINRIHPKLGCVDVDECQAGGLCGLNADCINFDGGYECKCKAGFQGDPLIKCVDIDECNIDEGICGDYADCVNVEGSFSCSCRVGYQGYPPTVGCEDVDECSENKNICGLITNCINSGGSFSCECREGSKGYPPEVPCEDVNECLENVCGQNSICRNVSPGFMCLCPFGYEGNGYDGCYISVENKACTANFDCCQNALCKLGTCSCKEGFVSSGGECLDIDECKSHQHMCGANADCTNTLGSYECLCAPGFTRNPPTFDCTLSSL